MGTPGTARPWFPAHSFNVLLTPAPTAYHKPLDQAGWGDGGRGSVQHSQGGGPCLRPPALRAPLHQAPAAGCLLQAPLAWAKARGRGVAPGRVPAAAVGRELPQGARAGGAQPCVVYPVRRPQLPRTLPAGGSSEPGTPPTALGGWPPRPGLETLMAACARSPSRDTGARSQPGCRFHVHGVSDHGDPRGGSSGPLSPAGRGRA